MLNPICIRVGSLSTTLVGILAVRALSLKQIGLTYINVIGINTIIILSKYLIYINHAYRQTNFCLEVWKYHFCLF